MIRKGKGERPSVLFREKCSLLRIEEPAVNFVVGMHPGHRTTLRIDEGTILIGPAEDPAFEEFDVSVSS